MTLSAVATAMTARTMNRIFSIWRIQPLWAELWVCRRPDQNHRGCDNHVDDRRRQQEFPAEAHQLIITKTRQREAYPHRQHDQRQHFEREIDEAQPRIIVHLWPDIATE